MLIADIARPMAKNRIKEHRKRLGWSQEKLAEVMETQQSTIGKLEKGEGRLTIEWIRRFAEALNVRSVEILPSDMLEEGGEEFTPAPVDYGPKPYNGDDTPVSANGKPDIVSILLGGNTKRTAWTLSNGDLAGLGYRKGDIVIVDETVKPANADVVCVQRYIMGSAQTLFRVYKQPFLLASPGGPVITEPIFYDPNQIRIVGVVTESLRKRTAT